MSMSWFGWWYWCGGTPRRTTWRKGTAAAYYARQPTCTCRSLPDAYRCIGPAARRQCRVLLQTVLLLWVVLLIVLWLGMEVQESRVQQTPDTLEFYTTPHVCGLTTTTTSSRTSEEEDAMDDSVQAEIAVHTFATVEDAQSSTDTIVAHCGDCGACSNPHDMDIYDATKTSLLATTVECGKQALVWGRKTAGSCLDETVGFTADCNTCWMDNIMCDIRNCLFICLWQGLFHQVEDGSSESSEALNRCTLCDEKRCGPSFILCAGANRRRSGIVSDIERNAQLEVCDTVSELTTTGQPWWTNETLQHIWTRQQQEQEQQQDKKDKDERSSRFS